MAEARDLKFGMQLAFAKAHHQIPLEEKCSRKLSGSLNEY